MATGRVSAASVSVDFGSADAEIERLLGDIDQLYEVRKRDASKLNMEKMKLSVVPIISFFKRYKHLCASQLDAVENVQTLDPVEKALNSFKHHLSSYGDLNALINESNILETLCFFFQQRTYQLLIERNLLLSRWKRFVRNVREIHRLHGHVTDYYKFLDIDLTDSLERFERLSFAYYNLPSAKDELSSINKENKQSPDQGTKVNDNKSNARFAGIEVADIVLYLRWLIQLLAMNRPIDLFMERVHLLPHSDIETLVNEYRNHITEHSSQASGSSTDSVVERSALPIKKGKISDFINTFEQLVTHYKIMTPIEIEDGRSLAYKVNKLVTERFEKTKITTLTVQADNTNSESTQETNANYSHNSTVPSTSAYPLSSRSEGLLLSDRESLHSAIDPSSPEGKPITIAKADWGDQSIIRFQQEIPPHAFSNLCRKQRKLDFQVRYEYDVISSENLVLFTEHLRAYIRLFANLETNEEGDTNKRNPQYHSQDKSQLYEMADIDIVTQKYKHQPILDPFDHRLLIPVGEGGSLLMLQKREKALQISRQQRGFSPEEEAAVHLRDLDLPIESVFASHEIFTYLQLRFIRIRDLRLALLHQLNFFRWIERRLVKDMESVDLFNMELVGNHSDPLKMGSRQNVMKLKNLIRGSQKEATEAAHIDTFSPSNTYDEFRCEWINGMIYVTNNNHANIIYDVSYGDLSKLEDCLLRTITLFISKDTKGKEEKDFFYTDYVTSKSQAKSDMLDAVYLSPEIDRQQMLYDAFVGQVDVNNAKVSLLNAYLELYEHPIPISSRRTLVRDIIGLMRSSIDIDTTRIYFDDSYKKQAALYQSEEKLIVEMINATLHESRDLMIAYSQPQVIPTKSDDKDELKQTPIPKKGCNNEADDDNEDAFYLDRIGLPRWRNIEEQRVHMHHPSVNSIGFVEFFSGGLGQIGDLSRATLTVTHKIKDVLQSLSTDNCSSLLCSLLVMRKIMSHWVQWQDTDFRLPACPKDELFHEEFIEHYRVVNEVMHQQCHQRHTLSSLLNNDHTATVVIGKQPATFETDLSYKPVALSQLIKLCRIVVGRHRLLMQWFQTDILHKTVTYQAQKLQLSRRLFLPKFDPLVYDAMESFRESDLENINGDQQDDEEEHFHVDGKNTVKVESTPLAIEEFQDPWLHLEFTDLKRLADALISVSSSTTQILKIQVMETCRLKCITDINWAVLNYYLKTVRNKDLLIEESTRERLLSKTKVNRESTQVDPRAMVFSSNAASRAFRRQILKNYSIEYQRSIKAIENEAESNVAKFKFKYSALDWFCEQQSELIIEAYQRAQVLHLVRRLENASNEDVLLQTAFNKSKSSTVDADRSDDNPNEPVYDVNGKGEKLKVWAIPTLVEVLHIPSQFNHSIILERTETAAKNIETFQALLYILVSLRTIYRSSITYGDILTDNGQDYMRQVVGNLKKEVLNFGQPIHVDKLKTFLLLTSTVHRAKAIEPYSAINSAVCANKICTSSSIEHWKIDHPHKSSYEEDLIIDFDFQNLTASNKKICRDRIVELEAYLDDIAHQTNLENYTIEHTLQAQHEYLKRYTRLIQMRAEMLSVELNRAILTNNEQLNMFMRLYKENIATNAYKNYIAFQRRKGTHIEELTASRASQHEFEGHQILVMRQYLSYKYTTSILHAVRRLFDQLVDERADITSQNGEMFSIPHVVPHLMNELLLPTTDLMAKSTLFVTFAPLVAKMKDRPKSSKLSVDNSKTSTTNVGEQKESIATKAMSSGSERIIEVDYNQYFICSKEQFTQAMITLSINVARWEQSRLYQMDRFYSELYEKLTTMLDQRETELHTLRVGEKLNTQNYERDVRLGAAAKASDIFAELAVMGAELSDLKKARKVDEKIIRNKVRDEYDDLVQDLSGQIHKLRARFSEYRLSSVEEAVSLMSDIKKDELLGFLDRDYPQESKNVATNLLSMEEKISELRDDNNDLKQVLSKLKSMYILRERTSKVVLAKKMRTLIADKRNAEEKLWESYRDSETREKVLRRNLLKCQKELVSAEAQLEMAKRSLKEEQRVRQHLQKVLSTQTNTTSDKPVEDEAPRRIESFTRFEFEKLATTNMHLHTQVSQQAAEIVRLEALINAKDWQQASKAIMARVRSPSPRGQSATKPYSELSQNLLDTYHTISEENDQLCLRTQTPFPGSVSIEGGVASDIISTAADLCNDHERRLSFSSNQSISRLAEKNILPEISTSGISDPLSSMSNMKSAVTTQQDSLYGHIKEKNLHTSDKGRPMIVTRNSDPSNNVSMNLREKEHSLTRSPPRQTDSSYRTKRPMTGLSYRPAQDALKNYETASITRPNTSRDGRKSPPPIRMSVGSQAMVDMSPSTLRVLSSQRDVSNTLGILNPPTSASKNSAQAGQLRQRAQSASPRRI